VTPWLPLPPGRPCGGGGTGWLVVRPGTEGPLADRPGRGRAAGRRNATLSGPRAAPWVRSLESVLAALRPMTTRNRRHTAPRRPCGPTPHL